MKSSPEPEAHLLLPGYSYLFEDGSLLRQALTHRSFASEHNERLEFLGDSLLNMLAAEILYKKFPELPEGELSVMRANLVRGSTLAAIAVESGLAELMRLGGGERRKDGKVRNSILADALEAVIAAVYLDGGFQACREAVGYLLRDRVQGLDASRLSRKDAKTRLQEWCQARAKPLPEYRLAAVSGADHQQVFRVECVISAVPEAVAGEAGSRKAAEQLAAEQVLSKLGENS